MSDVGFAIVVAVLLVILHLQQVNLLSGSLEEFWRRADEMARLSKVFFVLSLLSCAVILVSRPLGIGCGVAFMLLHLGFSMTEWKR